MSFERMVCLAHAAEYHRDVVICPPAECHRCIAESLPVLSEDEKNLMRALFIWKQLSNGQLDAFAEDDSKPVPRRYFEALEGLFRRNLVLVVYPEGDYGADWFAWWRAVAWQLSDQAILMAATFTP